MGKRMKNYDELMYRDNFMFVKIMQDSELCREVLECLLQRPISELTEIQTEKEIECQVDGKPIRLDVFNKDREGNIYDTEMQNLNKQTAEFHALPKRSRYYQSTIDNELLGKGDELPEDLRCFYKYVETGVAGNNLTRRIDAAVVQGKKNKAWRSQFMRERLALQDAIEEGRASRDIEIVEHMIHKGKATEVIADDCNIPIERVKEIEQNMLASAK